LVVIHWRKWLTAPVVVVSGGGRRRAAAGGGGGGNGFGFILLFQGSTQDCDLSTTDRNSSGRAKRDKKKSLFNKFKF